LIAGSRPNARKSNRGDAAIAAFDDFPLFHHEKHAKGRFNLPKLAGQSVLCSFPDPQVLRLNAPHRELLPERYSKPDKTGLTATVPPEGAEIDFSLSLGDN
jgi:hypothetical protein